MPSTGPSNAPAPGKFNVWIPNQAQNPYIGFDTLAEAQQDVTSHQMGVILDPSGQLDPNAQAWAGWNSFQGQFPAAPVVLNPAPPPGAPVMPGPSPGQPPVYNTSPGWLPSMNGAETAPITGAAADIVGVYAQPNSNGGGAQIAVRTHSMNLNEALTYQLFAVVNGSEMKLKELGTQAISGTAFMVDAMFDINYAELTQLLAVAQPGVVVGPGTQLAVKVTWPGGHDQGAGGAGGRGAHRVTLT